MMITPSSGILASKPICARHSTKYPQKCGAGKLMNGMRSTLLPALDNGMQGCGDLARAVDAGHIGDLRHPAGPDLGPAAVVHQHRAVADDVIRPHDNMVQGEGVAQLMAEHRKKTIVIAVLARNDQRVVWVLAGCKAIQHLNIVHDDTACHSYRPRCRSRHMRDCRHPVP